MGLVLLLFGIGVLCTLLWYCAIYALPLWAGFATGFWALETGAGVGAIAIGLIAGVAIFLLGRFAALNTNPMVRWLALAVFVAPAICAGFSMTWVLSTAAIPSPAWRAILSTVAGVIVGATTAARLLEPPESVNNAIHR